YSVSIATAMSHRFYLPGRATAAQTRRNILAVDIGATTTSFGVFEANGNKLTLIREATSGSRSLGPFVGILLEFRAEGNMDLPQVVSVGVAGTVMEDRVSLPYLSWELDALSLQAAMTSEKVSVTKALDATGYTLVELRAEATVSLFDSS